MSARYTYTIMYCTDVQDPSTTKAYKSGILPADLDDELDAASEDLIFCTVWVAFVPAGLEEYA